MLSKTLYIIMYRFESILILMNNYISTNRHKYYLKTHLVLVCKYRKKLLVNSEIDTVVKEIFEKIESKGDFNIDIMESDADHIHFLVSYPPYISITSIVRKLKQESAIVLWKIIENICLKNFGKNVHFGQMDILFVLLVKQVLILLENILKIKVSGIHPID